jgi:hypothetical protein
MPTIDLTPQGDSTQQSPYWVIGVVRFSQRVTYDRRTGQSFSSDENSVLGERSPIIITEAVSVQIGASKGSHVTSLTASLPADKINYLTHLFPGDWVAAWIVDGKEMTQKLISKLKAREPVNAVEFGPKFLGKVQGVNSNTLVDRGSGTVRTFHQLSAVGFSEFDTSLFYLPEITENKATPVFLRFLGLGLASIISNNSSVKNQAETIKNQSNVVVIDKMIPAILSVVFGLTGPFADAARIVSRAGSVSQSPNQPYVVPKTILSWFGVEDSSFSSLLHLVIGLQHYSSRSRDVTGLIPTNSQIVADIYPNTIRCGELLGDFSIVTPPLNNISVWAFLGNYLNSPVNEMYVAMKPTVRDDKIVVMPTLVIRQNPFSSDFPVITSIGQTVETTKFTELPRWKVSPSTVYEVSVTRSNTARVNYATALGTPELFPIDVPRQMVLNVPVRDDVDIRRHGLKPYMPSSNCLILNHLTGPQQWKSLLADIVIGEHHTISGNITMVGVYAPIAPGDNLEYSGVVYHIESVSHLCSISPDGQKAFQTTLSISHGVVADQDGSTLPTHIKMYPGIENLESDINPSITVDNELNDIQQDEETGELV